jgi:NADPH2:quinone reductase
MQGLLVTEYTEFNRLSVAEIPEPTLDTNQVRIRVKAAGVSLSTNLVVSGKYQRKPPLPFVPGTECAGEVIECGANVTRFTPGDRVFAALDWGAFAEEAVAFEVNTFPLSDALSYSQAINFNSYATVIAALTWPRLLNLQSYDTLLVHGAAGSIGLAAVEIGKKFGAFVIGTASSSEKRAAVISSGADHAIDYSDGQFREEVLDLTRGEGANAILDPVGGPVFEQSLRCIAFEGRICPIGFTNGVPPLAPCNIILVKNISVVGLNFGTYYGWSPKDIRYESENKVREIMRQFNSMAESGDIKPRVHSEFPLEEFREAMDIVTSRKSIGRVILQLNT